MSEFVDLYQNFVHKCIKFIKTLFDVYKHCIIELMSISLPPKFLTYDRFQYVFFYNFCAIPLYIVIIFKIFWMKLLCLQHKPIHSYFIV